MDDGGGTVKLTAEAIRQRLGFSTIAMPGTERFGAREIGLIREAGITRMEICGLHPPTHYDYHDAAQASEITAECQKQGVAIVAVHGPSLPYDCPYEEVRRAVVTVQAPIRLAAGAMAWAFESDGQTRRLAGIAKRIGLACGTCRAPSRSSHSTVDPSATGCLV